MQIHLNNSLRSYAVDHTQELSQQVRENVGLFHVFQRTLDENSGKKGADLSDRVSIGFPKGQARNELLELF